MAAPADASARGRRRWDPTPEPRQAYQDPRSPIRAAEDLRQPQLTSVSLLCSHLPCGHDEHGILESVASVGKGHAHEFPHSRIPSCRCSMPCSTKRADTPDVAWAPLSGGKAFLIGSDALRPSRNGRMPLLRSRSLISGSRRIWVADAKVSWGKVGALTFWPLATQGLGAQVRVPDGSSRVPTRTVVVCQYRKASASCMNALKYGLPQRIEVERLIGDLKGIRSSARRPTTLVLATCLIGRKSWQWVC